MDRVEHKGKRVRRGKDGPRNNAPKICGDSDREQTDRDVILKCSRVRNLWRQTSGGGGFVVVVCLLVCVCVCVGLQTILLGGMQKSLTKEKETKKNQGQCCKMPTGSHPKMPDPKWTPYNHVEAMRGQICQMRLMPGCWFCCMFKLQNEAHNEVLLA